MTSLVHLLLLIFCAMKAANKIEDAHFNHEILPNTHSPANLQLAANWLTRCVDQHELCNLSSTQDTYHPTRLLDLKASDDVYNIRLVERDKMMCDNPYVALSHCWGGSIPLVLKEETLHYLKKGINLLALPKTFRHAVALVRSLDIRYLWIDSLCIIQDSYLDWEQEASRMKDVYRNAILTIAATGAANSSAGCFFDRDIDLVKAVTISVSWLGVPQGTYLICDGYIWQDNIVNAPLNQRAWVVQERLLSPRILHFGRDQIAWECRELEACETFPLELPAMLVILGDIYSNSLLEDRDEDPIALTWERIVEVYTQGLLTEESDKCIALSGIVDALQSRTADTYYAGLWASRLVQNMCWTTAALENEEQKVTPKRPSRYRAPSWSWLSLDSNIVFYGRTVSLRDSDKIMTEVVNAEIQNSTQNQLGSIQGGHILCRVLLKKARWGSVSGRLGKFLILDGHLIDHGQYWNFLHSQIMMDLGIDEACNDVFCLPLLSHETPENRFKDGDYVGLILTATGERENEYRRVGCFQIGWDYGVYLLEEDIGSGARIKLPYRTLTIV